MKSSLTSSGIKMKNSFLLTFFFVSFLHFTWGQESADTTLMQEHMTWITKSDSYRFYSNTPRLDSVAAYVYEYFEKYGDTTYYQEFDTHGRSYRNVITVLNPDAEETIVIGAHYDVYGLNEGADDNASGVVGLMELVRLLSNDTLGKRIEFVAYTLEEPPFFRSEEMGSYIHAKSLYDDSVNVAGMICLEMIGYFDDRKGAQKYPLGILSLFYGKRGDYITLVNKMHKGRFARKFTRKYKKSKSEVKAKKFTAPKALEGVDFSDHLNYWAFGYSALMITDTAFYRNYHYHESTDTMEKLDFEKMAVIIDTVEKSLLKMSK